jgi:hypothetical protein
MQFQQSIQDRKRIPHPKCIKCGAIMFLSEIESNGPQEDKRTFECNRMRARTLRACEIQIGTSRPMAASSSRRQGVVPPGPNLYAF